MITLAEWRNRLAYQPLSLGLVALAASAALVIANQLTQPWIAAAEQRDLQTMLTDVLPAGHADNDLAADTLLLTGPDGKPLTLYRARKQGQVVGALFQTSSRGYAADIVVLIAVDTQGSLLGVRVIRHQETPGLGDKIEATKSDWIRSFDGHSLGTPAKEKWAVKKDGGVFDQFAGATITPRAVVKAVHSGLQFYSAHRTEILTAERTGEKP
jgi:Na+-translocating ferredoxin:NAD+ oxidoreductase subunit G